MVEWKPLIGALPPLNHSEWTRVFDLYRETPEFQKKNFWMGIDDFKAIFFWEWLHRFWGRIIGLIFAVPFVFYIVKGWIPEGYKLKLFGILLLGGLQGYIRVVHGPKRTSKPACRKPLSSGRPSLCRTFNLQLYSVEYF